MAIYQYTKFMATDNFKKKKESIKASIQRLGDSLLIAKIAGDKVQMELIEKIITRLEADLKNLKQS